MSRKVKVEIQVQLILEVADDVDPHDAVNEMDYTFTCDEAKVIDTEIVDVDIVDA
jgi:hypothetical protein